jgi:aldehyde dehydrogenase (NAD+)
MNNYKNLIEKQKTYFQTNITRDVPFRLGALQKLRTSIQLHEKELIDALKSDLNKSDFES